ncbi:MAG: hydrogenase maturation nickel metallochaperone HypA [Chloroflexi bacterium]|nr:hydrogenase maturation nickel metallochaperone HypA [Chloroflexota bacterium]
MHELSITQSILSIALEQAKTVEASKITRINLTIGELLGVADECVQFYFGLLSKDTIAAEAILRFDRPATSLRCRNCATVFSPNDSWACPNCGDMKAEIVSGQECFVNSIEVD